jgi:hypothetical protein
LSSWKRARIEKPPFTRLIVQIFEPLLNSTLLKSLNLVYITKRKKKVLARPFQDDKESYTSET